MELYSPIKLSNFTPKYAVDKMAKAAGHKVVRLPPYHCELSPIELAWSVILLSSLSPKEEDVV